MHDSASGVWGVGGRDEGMDNQVTETNTQTMRLVATRNEKEIEECLGYSMETKYL